MTLPRKLLTTVLLLAFSSVFAQGPAVRPIFSGTLRDHNGAVVGRVSVERRGNVTYVHLMAAEKATGATLELLASPSAHALKIGDHTGPGQGAVRVGRIDQAQARYVLPASVKAEGLRSVWVWCPSVRLPSARALLIPIKFGRP